ncbi:MAG TPA: hypothetical protein PKC49_00385, partial [Phycisphaerae bacterium]|nr:hypothetical protein [Phycisphaerae bacterium]
GAGAISEGQWEETVRLRQARERALGPAPSTGGALPGAAIVNDNRTIHVYGGVETTREMLQMEQVQY